MGWFKSNTPAPASTATVNQVTVPSVNATITAAAANAPGTISVNAASNGYNYNYNTSYNNTITSAIAPGSTYAAGTGIGAFGYNIGAVQPTNIISLHGKNNTEIVRLNLDGSVTWSQEIQIDEAAEAFSKTLRLSAELSSGITNKVKAEMRDTVFEEIITLAKIKGSLTLDDLTFMYESSKIMEKLKGGRE